MASGKTAGAQIAHHQPHARAAPDRRASTRPVRCSVDGAGQHRRRHLFLAQLGGGKAQRQRRQQRQRHARPDAAEKRGDAGGQRQRQRRPAQRQADGSTGSAK